jgi:hypothetical protein
MRRAKSFIRRGGRWVGVLAVAFTAITAAAAAEYLREGDHSAEPNRSAAREQLAQLTIPNRRSMPPAKTEALISNLPDVAQPVRQTKLIEHNRTSFRGQTWAVLVYRAKGGYLCLGEEVPGEGIGVECKPPATLFRHQPVFATWSAHGSPGGKSWDVIWFFGITKSFVSSLDLYAKKKRLGRIPMDRDHVFLAVLPNQRTHRGAARSFLIVAFDKRGNRVGQVTLKVRSPAQIANRLHRGGGPVRPNTRATTTGG